MTTISETKIFVGKIPHDARIEEVEDVFRSFGKIVALDLRPGFAFIEYADSKGSEQAVYKMHGQDFLGSSLVVEQAKVRGTQKKGFRVVVRNLAPRVSWQDLKDFGREAGAVIFSNVFTTEGGKIGVIEYETSEDCERALDVLDGKDLQGSDVRVSLDDGKVLVPTTNDTRRDPSARGRDDGYRGNGSAYADVRRGPSFDPSYGAPYGYFEGGRFDDREYRGRPMGDGRGDVGDGGRGGGGYGRDPRYADYGRDFDRREFDRISDDRYRRGGRGEWDESRDYRDDRGPRPDYRFDPRYREERPRSRSRERYPPAVAPRYEEMRGRARLDERPYADDRRGGGPGWRM